MGETTTSLAQYVTQLIGNVTSGITLSDVVLAIGAIITAIVVPIFVWKFGRKGFAAIRNALSGKGASF